MGGIAVVVGVPPRDWGGGCPHCVWVAWVSGTTTVVVGCGRGKQLGPQVTVWLPPLPSASTPWLLVCWCRVHHPVCQCAE